MGLWLSRDPIGYRAGTNLYGGMGNGPISVGNDPQVPSGWTTPSGGGLHLITDYALDNLVDSGVAEASHGGPEAWEKIRANQGP